MSNHSRQFAVFAVIAASLLPVTAAQAQSYGRTAQPAPLYPYVVQGTPNSDRPHKPADRALIQESRKHAAVKRTGSSTKKIVRDAPVVVEGQLVRPRRNQAVEESDMGQRTSRNDGKKRTAVIQADAEVTIFGNDRMTIRLFRKGHGSKTNARTQ